MREIKFRGKSIDDKKWVYGYVYQSANDYKIEDSYFSYLVEKETIGQYTELKDKNEKEIFEGDIVKVFKSGEWRLGKIIYEHSGFAIDVTYNRELAFGRTHIIENIVEVIGNIIDNPELLGERS